MPGTIKLEETETEFRLFLPYDQRDRAKGIEGRQWDPEGKCWLYPKTGKSYDALVREFRDDLVNLQIQRPNPLPDPGQSADDIRAALERQLLGISQQLRALSSNSGPERDVRRLEDAYRTNLQEAENLRLELRERAHRISALERELEAARHELDALRKSRQPARELSLVEQLKILAITATAHDPDFVELMAELSLDYHFPTEIAKHMERRLCKLTGSRETLDKLIRKAHEQNKLDTGQVHLAHTIRLQRNNRAHELEDLRLVNGRAYVCLFAAALLFPHLPEGD